jgi:hypothetical protein
MALPHHIPSASFCNADTFEKPLVSIRDFVWPSVKLFAPGTGAFGFVVFGDDTADVVEVWGVDCANAEPASNVSVAAAARRMRIWSTFRVRVRHSKLPGTIKFLRAQQSGANCQCWAGLLTSGPKLEQVLGAMFDFL